MHPHILYPRILYLQLILQLSLLILNERMKLLSTFIADNKRKPYSFSNNLSSHLERFVNYLQYTKNSSPKTIENYTLRINRFIEFVGDIDASDVKMLHIQDFRTSLIKQGLSPKTVNYHVVGLRSFFKFLLRNDIDTISPEKLDLELYKHQQQWELEAVNNKHQIEEKVKQNATTDPDFQSLFVSTQLWVP